MSIEELTREAESGDVEAQLALGKAYYLGEIVQKDFPKARLWLKTPVERNLPEAHYYFARLCHDNPKEALQWYMKAADTGFAPAQCSVGECYEYGIGTEVDYAQSLAWYKKSADQGYNYGQYRLGKMHFDGCGTTKDLNLAIKLFTKAADTGCAEAQNKLAICYETGNGVTRDFGIAIQLYKKSADQGYYKAQYNMAVMHEDGTVGEVDFAKAADLYRKAAEQGYDEAQYCLGFYYIHGLYLSPNVSEALAWFQKSADQGNEKAKKCVNRIKKVGHELERVRNQIEPSYFRVAQLLLQIPRVSAETFEMWEWLAKGKKPSKKEANKFFLACILSFRMKAAFVWPNTRRFVEERLGDPEDLWGFVLSHSLEEWKQKKREYNLHRYGIGHMRVWKIGRDLIQLFGGDARAVWEGQQPGEVTQRLYQLGDGKYGVGKNIANMIVGALIDTDQITGIGDVKADTNVKKVLGRVFRGYEYGAKEDDDCTKFARKIYPPNPWLLDQPLFFLGQSSCKQKNPDCSKCYLREECAYRRNKHSG